MNRLFLLLLLAVTACGAYDRLDLEVVDVQREADDRVTVDVLFTCDHNTPNVYCDGGADVCITATWSTVEANPLDVGTAQTCGVAQPEKRSDGTVITLTSEDPIPDSTDPQIRIVLIAHEPGSEVDLAYTETDSP